MKCDCGTPAGCLRDSYLDNTQCGHGLPGVVIAGEVMTCGHCGERPCTQHVVKADIRCDGERMVWTMGGVVIHRCSERGAKVRQVTRVDLTLAA